MDKFNKKCLLLYILSFIYPKSKCILCLRLQILLGHHSIKTTGIYANWVRKEELERWV